MSDLTTTYLNLTLKSPILVSSNPLVESVDNVLALQHAGAGAVILPSLFEEQLKIEDMGLHRRIIENPDAVPEVLRAVPNMTPLNKGVGGYLAHIYQLKQQVDIPIIGSLNGSSRGGWVRYARLLESVGVDALELNVYYLPTETHLTGADLETQYVNLVQAIVEQVNVPVAVKLNPYITALPNFVQRLSEAGAAAVVLFNRFYQPDFDLETMTVVPNVELSSSAELRLRLRWAAILYGRVPTQIAVTGGVHTAEDVVKALLAGADVVTVASALLRGGIDVMRSLNEGVRTWLTQHDVASADDLRGRLSFKEERFAAALARANYMRELRSYID